MIVVGDRGAVETDLAALESVGLGDRWRNRGAVGTELAVLGSVGVGDLWESARGRLRPLKVWARSIHHRDYPGSRCCCRSCIVGDDRPKELGDLAEDELLLVKALDKELLLVEDSGKAAF